MSSSEVTLSSKGQVVLPKEARNKLGLKKGDKLKVEFDQKSKTILMRPYIEPPKELFFRAGTRLTRALMNESRDLDESKTKKLLKALGVTP